MSVAWLGQGALDEAVFERLRGAMHVERIEIAAALAGSASECDVLVLGAGATWACNEQVAQWAQGGRQRRMTVIDQRVVDPEHARELAADLARFHVDLVDAPIHCENTPDFPGVAATLCGGADEAVARARPVLDAMGAKVIHFGPSGSGQTARLLVGAAAACNRMATYECAATGFSNGLSVADMANVLNRSSGANSASERVLPYLASRARTTDVPLAATVEELTLVSQLALRAGTPLLLANLVGELSRTLDNQLADGATFDDALALIEAAAGLCFAEEPPAA